MTLWEGCLQGTVSPLAATAFSSEYKPSFHSASPAPMLLSGRWNHFPLRPKGPDPPPSPCGHINPPTRRAGVGVRESGWPFQGSEVVGVRVLRLLQRGCYSHEITRLQIRLRFCAWPLHWPEVEFQHRTAQRKAMSFFFMWHKKYCLFLIQVNNCLYVALWRTTQCYFPFLKSLLYVCMCVSKL